MHQAPTKSLEEEMQRIEGKRARNVARTARYLDARLRTIGLDTDALDEQIREQRARKERERVRGRAAPESVVRYGTESVAWCFRRKPCKFSRLVCHSKWE